MTNQINFSWRFSLGCSHRCLPNRRCLERGWKRTLHLGHFHSSEGKNLRKPKWRCRCDHYHKWQDDIKLMKQLGLKVYRFSTAWSRVFPEGIGKANQAGLDFYDRLVDELLKNGIDPFLTLYHWDLPQALQDKGGWVNRDIVDWFSQYTSVMVDCLSDRVKFWATLNEPMVVVAAGHLFGEHAPGLQDISAAMASAHHLLLSHGNALKIIRNQAKSNVETGIVLSLSPVQPASEKEEDIAAAAKADSLINRTMLDPLFFGNIRK